MAHLLRDLTFAWRTLWQRPLPTAAAIFCLAVGIAAVTVIFGLVRTVVLAPLAFDEPDELCFVWLHYRARDQEEVVMSSKEALDLMEQTTLFERTAGVIPWYYNLTGGDRPERVVAGRVSASLWPMLGAEPVAGRVFDEEEQEQLAPVVVLSWKAWQRRFGGDRAVVGRTLSIDENPYTVIGVLPEGFELPDIPAEIFVPLKLDRASPTPRQVRGVFLAGRLAPGVTAQQADAELAAVASSFAERFPDLYPADSGFGIHVTPFHEQLVGDVRPVLTALFVAVAVVLLIACGNVAGLLLAQAAGRGREIALRVALGARRRDLVQQLLTESVLLALLGGGGGVLLAFWGLRLVRSADLGAWELPRIDGLALDGGILLFALAVSLSTGVLFGLAPALRASKPDLQQVLKESSKSTDAAGRRSLKNVLVAAEVALALVVLLLAGLTVRSLAHLEDVDPGFRTENVLTLQLFLARNRYPAPDDRRDFYRRLEERLAVLPGVESVGLVSHLPLGVVDLRGDLEVEGRETLREGEKIAAGFRMATPGYFATLGLPLREGRLFGPQDHAAAPPVVVVDEALARRLWPGESPLGKRLKLLNSFDEGFREVVGVVGQVRQQSLAAEADEQLYVPFEQYPLPVLAAAIHTRGEPGALIPAVRGAVASVDPLQPVDNVQTGEELLAGALARSRFHTFLFGFFGLVALVLSAVGVYSLLAQTVAERRREIGIRMALGARAADVVRQTVGQGLSLAAVGLVAGLAVAAALLWALSGWLADVVIGIPVLDLVTFVAVPLVLLALTLLASWLPARRATRVDPVTALRQE